MTDWYRITQKDFKDHGGESLVHNYYNGSPYDAVMSIFENHEWHVWKFNR